MTRYCDDCDLPFDSVHGLAMHYLNSGDHPDVDEFSAAERRAESGSADTGSDTSTDTSRDTPEFPDGPESGSSSTTSTAPDPEPESVSAPPTCPRCGSDDVDDAPAVARRRDDLDPSHVQLLMDSDNVCRNCGGVWDNE